jgi:hypothetical protein
VKTIHIKIRLFMAGLMEGMTGLAMVDGLD